MQPSDDRLPVEQMAQYEPILALLRHARQAAPSLTPDEQAHALTRVRTRLSEAEHAGLTASQEKDILLPLSAIAPDATYSHSANRIITRHTRIMRYINTFAAVLVIGAIIGVSLLLFRHQSQTSIATPARPSGAYVTVSTQAHGLSASISITPGPYFLSELLAADITLTNHSQTTYEIAGANSCDPTLWLNLTPLSAGARHYTLPPTYFFSCALRTSQLKPGQTFSIHVYIALTDSGTVQLTENAQFLVTKTTADGISTTSGPDPLKGHWPTMHIPVSTHIPANRAISLRQQGSKLLVIAPPAARAHLFYLYNVICSNTSGADDYWEPVSTTIQEPQCGKNVRWTYAVGAPGYAIATKSYP